MIIEINLSDLRALRKCRPYFSVSAKIVQTFLFETSCTYSFFFKNVYSSKYFDYE